MGVIAGADAPVVIVGGGIAGMATALHLAPVPVTLLNAGPLLSEAATALAQGGIAAALGDDDAPALHAADTLQAGAGLVEPAVALAVAQAAGQCILDLERWGAAFDRAPDGRLALGLEAAHSRRRIVHAGGDATGRAVLTALVAAARAMPSIRIVERAPAIDLVRDEGGGVAGVLALCGAGTQLLTARAVVLATGGIGGLFAATTNPLAAVGQGLAMASSVGAKLRDLEFVQFHPTAMALGKDPLPLASEAIRGEGAILIDDRGDRLMADVPGQELAAAGRRGAPCRRRASGGAQGVSRRPGRYRRALRRTLSERLHGVSCCGHRSGRPADPDPAGGALSHGRDRRGPIGAHDGPGPVGRRRGRRDRPARRQPARQQLSARGPGLREMGGSGHRQASPQPSGSLG